MKTFLKIIKYFFIFIFLWLLFAISHHIYYNFFGAIANNLDSQHFYIDDSRRGLPYIASYNETNNKNLYLRGVVDYEYNDDYIIVVRKDSEGFECACADFTCGWVSTSLTKKRLQYMLLDNSNQKVKITYNYDKFQNRLKESNIDLQFNKTNQELQEKLNQIKPDSLDAFINCKPINTYFLEEY